MVRVLVCGGRRYSDRERLYRVLDAAVERLGLTEIIHGDATGADKMADEWAESRGIPKRAFPAKWSDLSHPDAEVRVRADGSKYDRKAGPRRNQQMIDQARPSIVIAFPGDTGTDDMIGRANAAGIRVIEID